MVLLLSLASALAYGLSDFVGGVVTKRASAWAVAAISQTTATLLAVGLVATNPGQPGPADIAWGAVGGLGSGVGDVLIYQDRQRRRGDGRQRGHHRHAAIAAAALPVL